MDYLAFLERRLNFISEFYFKASEPFRLTKQKIDKGEEPFNPQDGPEDGDGEPEYLSEWIEADDGLRVLGQCTLNLVAKAIQDYLREFIMREAGTRKPQLSGNGWFQRYENFLIKNTPFSWEKCPVKRELIEQINLCRNDGTHDPDISTTWPKQTDEHLEKYPQSFFGDEMEAHFLRSEGGMPAFPLSIHVTAEKLAAAIDASREFCRYVEGCRTRWR
jgi:hypothetical protein